MLGQLLLTALEDKDNEALIRHLRTLREKVSHIGQQKSCKCYTLQCLITEGFSVKPNEKTYKKVHCTIIKKFIDFLLEQGDLLDYSALIQCFIYDMAETRLVDNFLCGGRDRSEHTYMYIKECFRFYLLDQPQNDILVKSMLTTFALRQALEIRLRRIIGIGVVENSKGDIVKLKHGTVMKVILDNVECVFLGKSDLLKYIKIIYKWANFSIHSMWSPPTWMIWEAYTILEPFFLTHLNEKNYSSINNAFQFKSVEQYKSIQQKIADSLSKQEKQAVTLKCIVPEATILDVTSCTPICSKQIPINDVVGNFSGSEHF